MKQCQHLRVVLVCASVKFSILCVLHPVPVCLIFLFDFGCGACIARTGNYWYKF